MVERTGVTKGKTNGTAAVLARGASEAGNQSHRDESRWWWWWWWWWREWAKRQARPP